MTKFKCRCFSWNWFKVRPLAAPNPVVIQQTKTEDPSTKVKVTTQVPKELIQSLDFTPEKVNRMKFPYNCPICMRFLSHILASECCSNYVCHTCAEEIEANKKACSRCPHCNAEPLALRDVEQSSRIRTYFDSPMPKMNFDQNLEGPKDETYSQSQILLTPISDC
mmetsp:Transcript_19131/g.34845  ORF Transcript_19131/g.34845 Transcript_19131/m.34845 type:complete len:165 (+) Transcript_19131:21-515(+)